MKAIAKFVLVAAVASMALSVSTPSFAAKKKAAKPAAASAACLPGTYTKTTCNNGVCQMAWCGIDGKRYPSLFWCWEPFCPKS